MGQGLVMSLEPTPILGEVGLFVGSRHQTRGSGPTFVAAVLRCADQVEAVLPPNGRRTRAGRARCHGHEAGGGCATGGAVLSSLLPYRCQRAGAWSRAGGGAWRGVSCLRLVGGWQPWESPRRREVGGCGAAAGGGNTSRGRKREQRRRREGGAVIRRVLTGL